MAEIDNPDEYKGEVGISETRLNKSWKAKQKYQYVKMAIDLRMHDPHGTLEVACTMDKDSCKRIPQVQIVDGFLIVALRKEL